MQDTLSHLPGTHALHLGREITRERRRRRGCLDGTHVGHGGGATPGDDDVNDDEEQRRWQYWGYHQQGRCSQYRGEARTWHQLEEDWQETKERCLRGYDQCDRSCVSRPEQDQEEEEEEEGAAYCNEQR